MGTQPSKTLERPMLLSGAGSARQDAPAQAEIRVLDPENPFVNLRRCSCGCGRYVLPYDDSIRLKDGACVMNFVKTRYYNWSCLVEKDRTE